MEIKLLHSGYKNNEDFYKAFIDNSIMEGDWVSDEVMHIDHAPDFPVYLGNAREDKNIKFMEMIKAIKNHFLTIDREIYMQEVFWHSYLCLYKRDYLIKEYPQILESQKQFENIVTKKFDWENYIYKSILAAQYVEDHVEEMEKEKFYQLIMNNMDVFNYIIKYEIFRNGPFMINVLRIIDDNEGYSKILKAKIKGREDLGKDERYGRRVILEFNKSYPLVLSPMLSKEELEIHFKKFLSYYYEGETVVTEDDWDLE